MRVCTTFILFSNLPQPIVPETVGHHTGRIDATIMSTFLSTLTDFSMSSTPTSLHCVICGSGLFGLDMTALLEHQGVSADQVTVL